MPVHASIHQFVVPLLRTSANFEDFFFFDCPFDLNGRHECMYSPFFLFLPQISADFSTLSRCISVGVSLLWKGYLGDFLSLLSFRLIVLLPFSTSTPLLLALNRRSKRRRVQQQ